MVLQSGFALIEHRNNSKYKKGIDATLKRVGKVVLHRFKERNINCTRKKYKEVYKSRNDTEKR